MQQTCIKWIQELVCLGGKGDPLEIVQEIVTWSYWQIVHAQSRICNSLGLWNTNRSPNPGHKIRHSISKEEKKLSPIGFSLFILDSAIAYKSSLCTGLHSLFWSSFGFWFLCFDGISTFMGYLMPKLSF